MWPNVGDPYLGPQSSPQRILQDLFFSHFPFLLFLDPLIILFSSLKPDTPISIALPVPLLPSAYSSCHTRQVKRFTPPPYPLLHPPLLLFPGHLSPLLIKNVSETSPLNSTSSRNS